MKYFIVLVCLLLFSISVFSQNSGYAAYQSKSISDSGYYYTLAGLKVRAFITVSYSGASRDLGSTFIVAQTTGVKKKQVLKTNMINAFTIGKDSFALVNSIRRSSFTYYERDFARVVSTGKLILFIHCQNVSAPTGSGGMVSTGTECFYFIQKEDSLYRFKKSDFKDQVDLILGDNEELMKKITQNELGFNDLEKIVAEYNNWYEKNNSTPTPD